MTITPARSRFLQLVKQQLNKPVCWAHRGPESYDCSGLVARCVRLAGGVDMIETHKAQMMADQTPRLFPGMEPLPGDLVFMGASYSKVIHVAVLVEGGQCIPADGATSRIRDLAEARRSRTRRPACASTRT